MERRFDISMLVSNGEGCGFIEHKTFIGENVSVYDVKKFIRENAVAEENKGLDITYTVFEGWGESQKHVCTIHSWIYN